jgi:hypothetical protein
MSLFAHYPHPVFSPQDGHVMQLPVLTVSLPHTTQYSPDIVGEARSLAAIMRESDRLSSVADPTRTGGLIAWVGLNRVGTLIVPFIAHAGVGQRALGNDGFFDSLSILTSTSRSPALDAA